MDRCADRHGIDSGILVFPDVRTGVEVTRESYVPRSTVVLSVALVTAEERDLWF